MKAAIYHFTNSSEKRPIIYQKELKKLEEFALSQRFTVSEIFCDKSLRRSEQPEFDRFFSCCEQFNVLITKDFYHISKNTMKCMCMMQELREKGVQVYTTENGIFSWQNAPLQKPLRVATYCCRFGTLNEMKEIIPVQNDILKLFANKKTKWTVIDQYFDDTKTITVNEEEAEVIRRVFEAYVYRNGTPASIQKALKKEGINRSSRTISNMIQDERYIGKFYINKRTSKLGTGQTKSKRIQLPKEQWVLVERPDLQIIDNELFEMAQRIHKTRITVYEKPDKKTTQARFQGTHKYAGKIFCPECGKPYHFGYSDRAKTKPIYAIKSHSECTNPVNRISETCCGQAFL